MNKLKHHLLLPSLIAAPAFLGATIPFVDNFDYATLNKDDTAVTSSQGAWYVAKFNNPGISQQIDGDAMTVTGIPTTSNMSVFGYFQNSGDTLAVGIGESITLQIAMSYTGSVDPSFVPFTSLRFGIYNSNGNRNTADIAGGAGNNNFNEWTGYSSTWAIGGVDGSEGNAETRDRPGADYYRRGDEANGLWNWGTGSNAHLEGDPVAKSGTVTEVGDPNAGTNGSIVLTLNLNRDASGDMEITSVFFDGTNTFSTVSRNHGNAQETSFDSIAFLVNNGTVSADLKMR